MSTLVFGDPSSIRARDVARVYVKDSEWRNRARPIIAAVIEANRGKPLADMRRAISAAYPFGSDIGVCAICGGIGHGMYRCAWKVEKEVRIAVADLRSGDRIRLGLDLYREVDYVTRSNDGITLFYRLRNIATPFTLRVDEFVESYLGLRVVPCANECCDNCAREVAEEVHYCRLHWSDWQTTHIDQRRSKPL